MSLPAETRHGEQEITFPSKLTAVQCSPCQWPAAKLYYEQFGFVSLQSNDSELFLPVKTIREALGPEKPEG